jgi:hypothetical protein
MARRVHEKGCVRNVSAMRVAENPCPVGGAGFKSDLVSGYSRTRKLYRRALGSRHARRLIRTTEIWRRLAASADAADLAVDVRIFLIKDIPGD